MSERGLRVSETSGLTSCDIEHDGAAWRMVEAARDGGGEGSGTERGLDE